MEFCLLRFMVAIIVASFSAGEDKKDSIVYLDRGSFMMGSPRRELLKTGEFPQKHIQVKPFAIDRYPVTNADFKVFKSEKPNYLTNAELDGYSWVFFKHKSQQAQVNKHLVHPDGGHWVAVRNATWYQPYGLGSNLDGKDLYPVIHVSYHDAYAFCLWAGKRVVSEYEWEYAARGGAAGNKFPWGNVSDFTRANLWQGRFPDFNIGRDGFEGVSPVDAYEPQNNFGMYDMIGNVWEWTNTAFTVPRVESDANNPQHTVRGGSFLDTLDGRVNEETRVSLRKGLSPDYKAENLGFRCAYLWKPGTKYSKPIKLRPPVRHRYEETWEYKMKHAVKTVIGNIHKTEEL
ncbi:hypothetical protein HELRODRAFT_189751 [Helobdella robusta]|uniref:Sulfatase-modifying factor enzyme-like domain-containing protein n=1 Tax=Helobdella robusta TaxID=6412 RepID=T1FRC1_HELRO|nr:hypothetical protein HELRODRAFT_189751 [Helobdella robusta]ESN91641.1 hypothetical protein HELRODRAFT_189751 [Helobdella robusta]